MHYEFYRPCRRRTLYSLFFAILSITVASIYMKNLLTSNGWITSCSESYKVLGRSQSTSSEILLLCSFFPLETLSYAKHRNITASSTDHETHIKIYNATKGYIYSGWYHPSSNPNKRLVWKRARTKWRSSSNDRKVSRAPGVPSTSCPRNIRKSRVAEISW